MCGWKGGGSDCLAVLEGCSNKIRTFAHGMVNNSTKTWHGLIPVAPNIVLHFK